jgi:hypothetical protein
MTWSGLSEITFFGFGSYSFEVTQMVSFVDKTETISISASTSLVVIYVDVKMFCGDNVCNNGETSERCVDCAAIFLEFEDADGSGPVNGPTVNYFLSNPRTENSEQGPNRNASVQSVATRTTGTASNTVFRDSITVNTATWMETVVTGYINFYWTTDLSPRAIDPITRVFRLRVHLSKVLTTANLNYRFVNTWKPIDATPEPFGPTDLNLHLFHPQGALDINNPILSDNGFQIGTAIADSKQSGGPATMDISPGSQLLVAVWNSKPPRSSIIAPSQNNRYLVNSGSYIVVYGKTSNAGSGKQLGQFVLNQYLTENPTSQSDQKSNLWWAGSVTIDKPANNQPFFARVDTLKEGNINNNQDLTFDCEAYAYCAAFVVPYSDTGRK